MNYYFLRVVLAASVFLATRLCADPVHAAWSFKEAGGVSAARQGVLSLGNDPVRLDSGLAPADFQGNNFTVSLLLRHDALPGFGADAMTDVVLFKTDRLTVALRRGSDAGNGGKIYATLRVGEKNILFKPEVRVDDGQWHGVTLRSDAQSNRIQIFLDGQLHANRDVEGSAPLFSKSAEFSFGPAPGAQVDELSVYNTALRDAEVLSNFNHAFYDFGETAGGIRTVRIFISPGQPGLCTRYAEIFSRHLIRRAPAVRVSVEPLVSELIPGEDELFIYAGAAGISEQDDARLRKGIPLLPTADNLGSEGFAVKLASSGSGTSAWIAGADARGVLYGFGRLLFLSEKKGAGIRWDALEETSAPRIALRSMNGNFKVSMDGGLAKKTGARSWTVEEGVQYWEESLLFGVNFYTYGRGRVAPVDLEKYRTDGGGVALQPDEVCADYGVAVCLSQSVNGLGRSNIKSGWNALSVSGKEDPHLGCLTVPEARQAILDTWAIYAKESRRLDYILLQAADIAGCHCPECQKDWPKTFYDLCCDIADTVHQSKPDSKVYFTNQEMSAAENEELFSLLRTDPDCPLAGYIYAPAGSENSTYGYLLKNPKWDNYPGRYPNSTFLKSRLDYLQPGQDILAFPDISHWKRAECGVPYIDPIIAEIYPRRTYNARPLAYAKVFEERMSYCSGISGYSEGNHDDFNKYFLLRMAWNPDLSPEEISEEYYTYYCGPAAGPLLAEAVFAGEKIYETPFHECGDLISRYRQLVEQAGECMPPEYLAGNWRYYLMAVRSCIDSYLYGKMTFQQQQVIRAEELLRSALEKTEPESLLQGALDILSEEFESDLLVKARQFDQITDKAIGLRSYALTKAEQSDAAGVYWLREQIESALREDDVSAVRKTIQETLYYDQVGPGEFYDNCGTIDQQPHYDVESGELYYGTGSWPLQTRPSQRWYNYSFEAQDGLEFNYSGLDPNAEYTVTVTWPSPKNVSFAADSPNSFYIEADGVWVGEVIPPDQVEQFSFNLPVSVTQDGIINIALRKVPGQSRCTCISEIWVRKKK